jgi:hypothetical protein
MRSMNFGSCCKLLALVLGVGLAGCGKVSYVRLGLPEPANSTDTPVRFDEMSPQMAMGQGESEVASGCAYDYDGDDQSFTDDMKHDIAPIARRLGGDMVVVSGTCEGGEGRDSRSGLEFMVFRDPRGPFTPGLLSPPTDLPPADVPPTN